MQKCNIGNGGGYRTSEHDTCYFYLDLLQTLVKYCDQKKGETLYFS